MAGDAVSLCSNPSITVYQSVNFYTARRLPLLQLVSLVSSTPLVCLGPVQIIFSKKKKKFYADASL